MSQYFRVELNSQHQNSLEMINRCAVTNFGCDGIEEFSLDQSEVDEMLGDASFSGGNPSMDIISEIDAKMSETSVAKYFYSRRDQAEAFLSFAESFDISGELSTVESQDWNAEWRKYFKVIPVSERLEIVPAWERDSYLPQCKFSLYINPGMGFGTGSHETTFLCLKLVDQFWDNQYKTCLDFGTGSGILGLAAYKLGANKIDLYDIDPAAIDNAIENIDYNVNIQLDSDFFSFFLENERDMISRKYDVVFANILLNVLEDERDFLVESVEKSGVLILSGLLSEQINTALDNYLSLGKLEILAKELKGDWGALIFRKL